MKILITGATGSLGLATIDFLLSKISVSDIIVMVRNTEKAESLIAQGIEFRIGDYNMEESLNNALKEITTLLLISTNAFENRFEQHKRVIDAASKNGVQHIVYTSVLKASEHSTFEPGIDHYKTEEYIKKQPIRYTILRNTFYAEIIPMLMGDALQTGTWYYPARDAKANFVTRNDIAQALANVLSDPSGHVNKIYEIASGESYKFSEIATLVSDITNTHIAYISIPVEMMKDGMRKSGLPESMVSLIVSGAEAIGNGELESADPSLEKILGRKPANLKDVLSQLLISSK